MSVLPVGHWMAHMLLNDTPVEPDKWLSPPTVVHEDDGVRPAIKPCAIQGYTIREHLGSSNFAFVYRVVKSSDSQGDEDRAIKEFVAKVFSNKYSEGDFLRELHFLRAVQFHPNVMALAFYQVHQTRAIVIPIYECDLFEYFHQRD
eukprot:TRINITY_DN14515_c1_g1_i1.p1 TRINITY_DN14515_c1_g1~~TRINITY_DN14515_c1_g1_i1.p1  ORF type:complete len:146 (+),score=7.61 TRINITY_DN14515_c1_g1_i1:103-540(+)